MRWYGWHHLVRKHEKGYSEICISDVLNGNSVASAWIDMGLINDYNFMIVD